jgi:PAS domain S-box-containing protein
MSPDSSVPLAPSSAPPVDGGAQSRLLAAALAELSEGVLVTDAAGRLVLANAAAARRLGIPALDAARPEADRGVRLLDGQGAPLARGREPIGEVRWCLRRADGSEVSVEGRARVLPSADGRPLGWVLTLHGDGAHDADRLRRERDVLAEQLREAFAQAPVSTVVYDASGRVLAVNAAFERLWGIGLADLPSDYSVLRDPQLEAAGQLPTLRRAFGLDGARTPEGAGEPVALPPLCYDVASTAGRGRTRWTEAHAYPVRDDDGAVARVVLTHDDVTVRLEAEAALRSASADLQARNAQLLAQALDLEAANQQLQEQTVELELQAADLQATAMLLEERTEEAEAARQRMLDTFEAISDPFFTVDRDWILTYVNPPTERVVGRPREQLIGRHLWEEFSEAVGTPFHEGALRALREQRPVDVEAHYPPPLDFWATMRMYPLADGLAVYYQDVTLRKRAEAALRTSEARLRDLFEQAPVAVAVLTGPDHVYTIMSPRYAAFVPIGTKALGLPFREAVPEVVGQGVVELMDRVYQTAEPHFVHERAVRLDRDRDGVLEDYYFDIGYQPLCDADGVVYAIASVSVDVTAQVVARRDAERARHAAEAANRAKSEFLSTMSHELRTPLNAIAGYTELLTLGLRGPVSEAQQQDLERIRRANQHLMGLVTDILNFARLEAGQVEFLVADVPLARVVADLESLVGPQLAAKSLTFDHDGCTGDGSAPSLVVRADPEKLRQVLLNLLTNAIKFTDPGGHVALTCAAEPAAGLVRLRVSDTGRGIAPEQLDRIFEPFVQVDRHRTHASQQGVGLGLAISRDLARGMNGDLSVESAPEVGSTFTLTLPIG